MIFNKTSILFAVLITVMPYLSWAEREPIDPIDKRLVECINNDSSTSGMTKCAIQSIDAWRKELDAVYLKLMKRSDTKSKSALRKSQKQWVKYKDDQFKFIDAYYDSFEGTMYLPMRASDKADLIKERTIKLRSYLKELDMK